MYQVKFPTRYQVFIFKKVIATAKKDRVTVDNKKCQSYWFHNLVLINGCTMKNDPDGNSGKEWCRFETDGVATNAKNWAYCSDDLDFDQIRQAVADFYQLETITLNKFSLTLAEFKPMINRALN